MRGNAFSFFQVFDFVGHGGLRSSPFLPSPRSHREGNRPRPYRSPAQHRQSSGAWERII